MKYIIPTLGAFAVLSTANVNASPLIFDDDFENGFGALLPRLQPLQQSIKELDEVIAYKSPLLFTANPTSLSLATTAGAGGELREMEIEREGKGGPKVILHYTGLQAARYVAKSLLALLVSVVENNWGIELMVHEDSLLDLLESSTWTVTDILSAAAAAAFACAVYTL